MATLIRPQPAGRRHDGRWFTAIAIVVPLAVAVACAGAALLGYYFKSRHDLTYYFYTITDSGHPGALDIIGTAAFITVAVLLSLLALTVGDRVGRRRDWLGVAVLFTVIAADELMRLHNNVHGGDVISRLVYWGVLAFYAPRLGRIIMHRRGSRVLLVGLAFLLVSELIDLFTPNLPHGVALDMWGVFEESTGHVGAVLVAVAVVGLASELLADAGGPVTVEEAAPRR